MIAALQDVHQASRHLSLKPGARQQPQIVDQTRDRNNQKYLPLYPKIGTDSVRLKLFIFHLYQSLLCSVKSLLTKNTPCLKQGVFSFI